MIPSDILETLKDACVQRKHDLCAAGYDENDELTKGFFARYDAALAWLEAHAQPQAAGGVYSHRNGESDPPTERGWYWFYGRHIREENRRPRRRRTILHVYGGATEFEVPNSKGRTWQYQITGLDLLKGKWWGPVTPPWETSQRPQAQD